MNTPIKSQRYINAIRNPEKRAYAIEYRRWLRRQRPDEPSYKPLSYRAAQAVRLTLSDLQKVEQHCPYCCGPLDKDGLSLYFPLHEEKDMAAELMPQAPASPGSEET